MQPQKLKAGASEGATILSIGIEDGDGDIGFGTNNLYLTDSRDHSTIAMMIPTIPNEYSPSKGIRGTIVVNYLAAWLATRPDTAHILTDTLHWDIYLKDQAGHVSNTISTEDLILYK